MTRKVELSMTWTDSGEAQLLMVLDGFVPALPSKSISARQEAFPTLRRGEDRIDAVRDQVIKQLNSAFASVGKEIEVYEFVMLHIDKAKELVAVLPAPVDPRSHPDDNAAPSSAGSVAG